MICPSRLEFILTISVVLSKERRWNCGAKSSLKNLNLLSSSLEFLGNFGMVLSLVVSQLQFKLGRPPFAMAGISSGAIATATLHLIHLKHAGSHCVANRHVDHSMVNELRDCCQAARLKTSYT